MAKRHRPRKTRAAALARSRSESAAVAVANHRVHEPEVSLPTLPAARPISPHRPQIVRTFIGLGANLGDAAATLDAAVGALTTLAETQLLARSRTYRSAPIDAQGPDYFNAVVELDTTLSADVLLHELQQIEHTHGRERPYRNAPRTLDLDLLLYADHVIATPDLTVPHPRLHERAFVLLPLQELAPELVIPARGKLSDLLPTVMNQRIEVSA